MMRHRLSGVAAAVVAAAGLVITSLSGCSNSPPAKAVNASALGVQVSAPPGALKPGATLNITRAPGAAAARNLVLVPIGQPVQISPSQGGLQAEATITFHYPQQLPAGIKPTSLMVAAFNPLVHAWLPVDSALNQAGRTLTVHTSHFSTWGVVATNPQLLDSENDFEASFTPNPGDPFGGWLQRLLPPVPHVACMPFSYRLTVTTTDYGNPDLQEACSQRTDNPDVVTLKLANVNAYPVLVKLPVGVHVIAGQNEGETFEEVMSELLAQYAHRDSVLLRGGSTIDLEVHVSELPPDAQITMDVDPGLLLEDMGMWTIEMGADQKGATWEALTKLKETKQDLDSISTCLQKEANGWYNDPKILKQLKFNKDASKLIGDAINNCAGVISKGVHGFWNKAWEDVQGAGSDVVEVVTTPVTKLATMIHQFTTIWNDPHVITEWSQGLIAALYPDHASRVTITLARTNFSGDLSQALPKPSEYGFQTTNNQDTRGVGRVEPEEYLPPQASPGTCTAQSNDSWLGTTPPRIAAGSYYFTDSSGGIYAQQVMMALVPIQPGETADAASFISSLQQHCFLPMTRSGQSVTATLWKSPNFGEVTRVYQVMDGKGAAENELMFFAVSGSYYVYVQAAPGVPAPGGASHFGSDIVTEISQALLKMDETIGTHFMLPNGYTPGNVAWNPGTVPATSGLAAFVGTWDGHSRELKIDSSGHGSLDWRTYVICGSPEAKPGHACEPANNPVSEGGHVTFQLRASGDQAVAHVLTSNDVGFTGDMQVTVEKRNTEGQPVVVGFDQLGFCNLAASDGTVDFSQYCGA